MSFQILLPQFRTTELPVPDDPWIQDPNFDQGCQASSSGWSCPNGTWIADNTLNIPSATNGNSSTRLTGGADHDPPWNDPPAGNMTLYFTLVQLAAGSGIRLRTTGNILQGQWQAGVHEFTYTVSGGLETIQWEAVPGFGDWQFTWCSTVRPGP